MIVSQIGPRGEKKCSEEAIADGQKDGKTDEQRGPNYSGVASPTLGGGGIRNESENKEIQSEIEGQRILRSIRIMVNRNIAIKEVLRSEFCIQNRLLQTFIKYWSSISPAVQN